MTASSTIRQTAIDPVHLGTRTTLFAVAAASVLVALAAVPRDTWLGTATLSLAAGVAAFSMMAWAALLGGRLRWVEALFGGLDRVYETHKWLGVWALVLASVHLVFKAGTDGWDTAAILALPPPATRLVRQLSYVALVLIVVLALNRAIPYRAWRWWHKLSGPLFLVVVVHWVSIRSPIALASPAGAWLAAVTVLGLVAATYKLVLYPFVSSHAEYRVVEVTPGPGGVVLALEPVDAAIACQPGQFGFLSLKEPGLREPHPFTIASAAGADMRFVVRALGDYTSALVARVRPGMLADVYAPFGRFLRRPSPAAEVWVAGGVGISPFLAWLDDASASDFGRVALFYFHARDRDMPSADAVCAMAASRGARCRALEGAPGREFDEAFAAIVAAAGGEVSVHACGPPGLVAHVRARMRALGLPASRLFEERFNVR